VSVAAEAVQFAGAGVRLVGERWAGDENAPPVLLLHGGGQTRHSWARTAERLAAGGHTAYALDLRGHGDSDWAPDGDYSLDAFTGDIAAVARAIGRPPVLVGASLGGITSLVVAGEHPELAAGLVLVDVVVSLEPAGVKRIVDFMTGHLDGFATLDEVADAIAAYNPHRRRPRNLDGLRKNVRLGPDGRWHWHWDPAFMRIDDEPRRRGRLDRLRAAAAGLAVPTLLVRGARSDVVSDAGIADMLALVPSAEVADVQAAGHMVAGDDNDVFAARLEECLARLR
jgi:non-heme chloroperoxidase